MQQQFIDEILAQPLALMDLLLHYESQALYGVIAKDNNALVLLTGMGASYHAALIAAAQLQRRNIFAQAIEAIELVNYPVVAAQKAQTLVYISQSGASGEVAPLFDKLPAGIRKLGITNHLNSPLAERSDITLPLCAGDEFTVATKTYVNSLAVLGLLSGIDLNALHDICSRISQILDTARETRSLWLDMFSTTKSLYFLGHGPHAVTARHCAMMVAEWAKRPAFYASIGAFRHGFLEAIEEGTGVVIFAPKGIGQQSAYHLTQELESYGARVLLVENGHSRLPGDKATLTPLEDELLSPMVDIIPVQLFVEAMAYERGISPGFRYISKVVKQL
jgi:glutamine---fructose-6-phosphate transaminase (isomerizing)